MENILKLDGFLPHHDGDSESNLYRVITSTEPGKQLGGCVVLLVDTSGSMCYAIHNLRKAVISTVDIIVNQRKIASLDDIILIPFHCNSTVYSDFKNFKLFEARVMGLNADGGTNYYNAINDLTKLLKRKEHVVAVMFSDGEPSEKRYIQSIETLKNVASTKSLLLHSIGLSVSYSAEKILRDLTTVGSAEGYYQSIDDKEITAAMNVLVDHFSCSAEALINGKRTRRGFIVDTPAEQFKATIGDEEVALDVVNSSFVQMLEENSFEAILDAIRFLLESYLKNESVPFERATAITENIASLIRETENKIKMIQREKAVELSNEKKAKVDSIAVEAGASRLKQLSEIVSEHNKQVQKMLEEQTALLTNLHEMKELCAQIQETLHKNQNISASVSGEVMDAISQFRDNSIALKRKNIARLSSKVRAENEKFQNIDKLLQDELDQLVKLENIAVPKYFEDYSDPITLNDFQDVLLYKYGIFMLLINIERHDYGITAPHKTKIIQIGGFSSSVLDVMMKNEDKSLFFDFRGIGFGNSAVPLWISDEHWRKAKHVFGPFVGYAVTGNELEYTKLQGMTLLALILIHLRGLEPTEYNQQLIEMVGQTLKKVIDRKKWEKVASDVANTFETLNENVIPSVEVFLVFQEFIGVEFPHDKALLLLAEEYRRKNVKYIEENFEKLKFSSDDKCSLLIRVFPKIFEQYLNVPTSNVSASLNKKSMENYFMSIYDGRNNSKSLKWFSTFSQKLGPSLGKLASSLDDKQKMAIVLSVHKCICFKWEAIHEIPAGLSYDGSYPDILLSWCKKHIEEKEQKLRAQCHESSLLRILQTKDEVEAETLLRDIKRNSHTWAVMMKVLLVSCKVKRPPKLTVEQWEEHRKELFKNQMASMAIPLHFQLLMFCIFDSFKPKDWDSSKMIWRPNILLRRRIRAMFPEAPAIE